jgi:hypothetical protein
MVAAASMVRGMPISEGFRTEFTIGLAVQKSTQ